VGFSRETHWVFFDVSGGRRLPLLVLSHLKKTRKFSASFTPHVVRRFSLFGAVVGHINEVNQRQARLVLGWATIDCR